MTIHAGRLNGRTNAGRLYEWFRERRGQWHGTWDLTIALRVVNVSGCISEIRPQLPANERIEHRTEGKKNFYRLCVEYVEPEARAEVQAALAGSSAEARAAAKAQEVLVTCGDCGTSGFTPAGLRAHRGTNSCKRRQVALTGKGA